MSDFMIALLCLELTPVLLVFVGLFMKYCPVKRINGVMGYRTWRSMKDPALWMLAQKYCGELMVWTSLGMIVVVAIVSYVFRNSDLTVLSLAVTFGEIAGLFIPVVLTERRLKREDCR